MNKREGQFECVPVHRACRSVAHELQLQSAPKSVITVLGQLDRPQPRLNRDAGNGMTVTIGRLFPEL